MITNNQFFSMVQVGLSDNAGYDDVVKVATAVGHAFGKSVEEISIVVVKVGKARSLIV